VRDLTKGVATTPAPPTDEAPAEAGLGDAAPIPAHEGEAAMPVDEAAAAGRGAFPRSKFLEFSTLGLGGVIGGIVTLPAVGFMIVPPFLRQGRDDVDLGPLAEYPEGQFVIATFLSRPEQGEVSRRTAYVRNNGVVSGRPSFTIVSSTCVHLGCPVQPNGPLGEEKTITSRNGHEVKLTTTQPAGFGCPCHGGQYDTEGNRTAGPPVRALDRYEFSIRNGRLFLGEPFSVNYVDGEGASARLRKYDLHAPGQHVSGVEGWLYPFQPPRD
jgi:Rieske Fe-S protein